VRLHTMSRSHVFLNHMSLRHVFLNHMSHRHVSLHTVFSWPLPTSGVLRPFDPSPSVPQPCVPPSCVTPLRVTPLCAYCATCPYIMCPSSIKPSTNYKTSTLTVHIKQLHNFFIMNTLGSIYACIILKRLEYCRKETVKMGVTQVEHFSVIF
jgi:hypothetical protein